MKPFLYVFGTILCTAIGQFLIKYGVLSLQPKNQPEHPLSPWRFMWLALTNVSIVAGLALAFAAAMLWIFAMRTFPLNYAYPFTALTIAIVTVGGSIFFRETLSPLHLVSFLLIITGVSLLFFAK